MSDHSAASIAVIGMAGRFPGGKTLQEFWERLRAGVESIRDLSDEELLRAGVDRAVLDDPHYVKRAAVLDDVDQFDAAFFGFSPKDAAILDPQHRVFLECAWEALEQTGWTADDFPGAIGVYAGSGMNAYLMFNLLPNRKLMAGASLFQIKQTGNDKDVLATRISYQLNLTGPSVTVQTACSTSLVAVHQACQSLLFRECDMALAGGVTIEIPHAHGYVYREGEILSRDGHCRSFDAESTGTVFGSGAGVVVLRRLEDALAEGDPILAVIRGTAINNDGARKVGYLAPSVDGQADVIAEALAVAGAEADSISYVETHGTGTAVGDPIEIAALTKAFRRTTERRGFCGIGSLKSNIGHLDSAAGVAGLIKTILALRHGELPPSLHFRRANPLIDFAASPFRVNDRLTEWTRGAEPRRAGVTALGIGGTNAHVIVEEAPTLRSSGSSRPHELLVVSAKTAAAADQAAMRLADHLASEQGAAQSLPDVAWTTQVGRKAFAHRRAVVCGSRGEAVEKLRAFRAGDAEDGKRKGIAASPGVAFLFPGQGAQYPGMGRGLYEQEPVFRREVDRCLALLKAPLGDRFPSVLFAEDSDEAKRSLAETQWTQPALFAVEYALAQLWMSWGIQPQAMIGHSIGELVAAAIAGVMTLPDALDAVAARGRLMSEMAPGAMVALGLPEAEVVPLLGTRLSLAAVNAPGQTVVSGDFGAVEELERTLAARGLKGRRLQTSHAFHSASMDPMLDEFASVLARFRLSPPSIPFLSNVTGTWIRPEEATDPLYWARHLRNTVRFADGLRTLWTAKGETPLATLEAGPGRTLTGLAARHPSRPAEQKAFTSLPSLGEPVPDGQFVLGTLGAMWTSGVPVDWRRFHDGEIRNRVALPSYPFERRRFWIDAPRETSFAPSAESEAASERRVEQYRPVWKQSADLAKQTQSSDAREEWLLFEDGAGLGAELSRQLSLDGHGVTLIKPAARFAKTAAHQYTVSPGNPRDYENLLEDLAATHRLPRRILNLWPIELRSSNGDRPERDALETLGNTEDLCFFSTLHLMQAIGAMDLANPIELGVVSNSLQSVAGETTFAPERAVLIGPAKLVGREFSTIGSRAIDVQLPEPHSADGTEALRAVATQLIAELRSVSDETVIAYREGVRWHEALERQTLPQAAGTPAVRHRGVYLLTGGLGDIGLRIAQELASSAPVRLVLVGRTATAPKEAVQALEAHGAEVVIEPADVRSLADIERVVARTRERWGAIHGAVHLAGVLDDGLIQLKTRESALRVLDPKVRGTLVLEQVLRGAGLDWFLLFGSVSTHLRPIGQVDYVAANAFLDSFAVREASRPAAERIAKWTSAIDWGKWRGIGMGSRRAPGARAWGAGTEPAASGRVAAEGNQGHPLLGVPSLRTPEVVAYQKDLAYGQQWILDEHRLQGGDGLLPGTGYVELARAAGRDLLGPGPIEIGQLNFEEAFRVPPGETRGLEARLERTGDHYRFSVSRSARSEGRSVHSNNGSNGASGGGRINAQCMVRVPQQEAPPRVDVGALMARCGEREEDWSPSGVSPKQARYIAFGPRFLGLKRIRFGKDEAVSTIEIGPEYEAECNVWQAHPAILDAAMGSTMFTIPDYEQTSDLYIPLSYKAIRLWRTFPRRCYVHIRPRAGNTIQKEVASFDFTLIAENGEVIAEIDEFVSRRLNGAQMLSGASGSSHPAASAHAESVTEAGLDPQAAVQAFRSFLESRAGKQVVIVAPGTRVEEEARNDRSVRRTAVRAESQGSAAASSSGTRDDIEASLRGWWEELLGVEHVDLADDFFDLGGHSLTAVTLFARIKKQWGLELGLARLFEARTVAALSALIRRERERGDAADAPWASMVRIQKGGSAAPLFFVHGLGGNVVGFSNLVRHLGPAETIYALQAQGLDGKQPILTTVEAMARHYLSEIATVQPSGPYYLVGYSFGGLIAFEMAQQLKARGDEVAFLALFDTTQLHSRRTMGNPLVSPRMMYRYIRRLTEMLSEPVGRSLVIARSKNKIAQFLLYAVRTEKLVRYVYKRDAGKELPRTEAMVQAANIQAAVTYEPQIYPGRLTIFRATERSIVDRFDESLGWDGLATEGIEVHGIPGNHVSVGEEPNVRVMADQFRECITRARAEHKERGDRKLPGQTVEENDLAEPLGADVV